MGSRRLYVDGATLHTPFPLAGDFLRPPTQPTGSVNDILVEADVTVAYVRLGPSAVLLRCRARNVSDRYVRLCTAYSGPKIQPFNFSLDDMEGNESARVRMTNLLTYIEVHQLQIAILERDIYHKAGAAKRLKKASRGGGTMQRLLKLKDDPFLVDITRLKRPNEFMPPEDDDDNKTADCSAVVVGDDGTGDNRDERAHVVDTSAWQLYPASFKDDV